MLEEIGAVLIADALQKQSTESAINDIKRKGLESTIESLKRNNAEQEAIRKIQDSSAAAEKQREKDHLNAVKDAKLNVTAQLRRAENELTFHKNLIATNPATVANHSPEFKKEYMRECDLLSEWMMSQKGFKDIANKFGEKLGYSEQEVRKMATTSGIDIMTKEANERKAKGEMQGDYDQYNVERVERVKETLTERFLK